MKLEKIETITGTIRVLTGLHIGGNKDNIEIGGMDQPIIKNPLNGEPYIPGSSIKGKMRSLIELGLFAGREQTMEYLKKGEPCGCGETDCVVCRIFGSSSSENRSDDLGPTRIIVRDAYLTEEFRKKFDLGELPMEEKYENTIHRIKGVAEHPRPLERVPAGVEFKLNISFKVFDNDPEDLIDYVFKGLRLIELDAIGGHSSRGCGQVEFCKPKRNGEPLADDFLKSLKI
ncbi:MAG: type III-A CRISPR-associated RAMP protein Csm3 [Dissulfuribacterales bacterium]